MFKKKGSQGSHSSSSHVSHHSTHNGISGAQVSSSKAEQIFGSQEPVYFNNGFVNAFNPYIASQFGGGFTANSFGESQRLGLAFDIYQEGENLIVEIPFPRLNPETLTIIQENRFLKVSGSTEVCTSSTKGAKESAKSTQPRIPIYIQVPRGYFEQIIQLPLAVQEDQASASYEDGVLTISIKLIGSGRENRVPVSFA